jgi:hypothetical protein
MIAGSTAFDKNLGALAAVMGEWDSGKSYESREADLRGDATSPGFGQRLNGNYFLIAGGPGATVFDDRAVDVLLSQGGRNWYFADVAGPYADRLYGRRGDEWLDPLR